MNILVKNGQTFCNDFHFHNVDVKTNGKNIEKVADHLSAEGEELVIDAEGKYVIPGLIDIHSHGCVGQGVPCYPRIHVSRTGWRLYPGHQHGGTFFLQS